MSHHLVNRHIQRMIQPNEVMKFLKGEPLDGLQRPKDCYLSKIRSGTQIWWDWCAASPDLSQACEFRLSRIAQSCVRMKPCLKTRKEN